MAAAAHVLIPLLALLDLVSWPRALVALFVVHLGLVYGSLWPRSRWLGPNLLRVDPGQHGGRRVYLTFDDGPDPEVTPRVLEMLATAGARATFFVVGDKAARHPDLIRRMAAEGHTIGNHSQRHRNLFSLLGPWRMAREIDAAQETIGRLAGRTPRHFRAPAGVRSPWLGILLDRRRLALVTWTRRGFDAVSRSADRVLARLTTGLRPGDILVLHDGGAARGADGEPVVCRVLPRLLERLVDRGLQAAALPDPRDAAAVAGRRIGRLRQGAVKAFHLLFRPDEPPARKAAAFGCGVFIGCLPLYGLHLALSVITARLLRLSPVRIYLGAHVNNPLTAAPLLYAQVGLGSLLLGRPWPTRLPSALADIDLAAAGAALAAGSLAIGAVLALVTAGTTLRMARAWEASGDSGRRAEAAALHYLPAGLLRWGFARGKLRHDPLYPLLGLAPGLAAAGDVLDLGCGVGLVLAWLRESGGSRPPRYVGLDGSRRAIQVARKALGRWGCFETADIRTAPLPAADAVILADVLHYMGRADQDAVMERAARCLRPGGSLLLREADAAGGWRFLSVRVSERLRAALRGSPRAKFHYRRRKEWCAALEELGLQVSWQEAGGGTPFANVLVTARRPSQPAPPAG